jgi:hypothetical protein
MRLGLNAERQDNQASSHETKAHCHHRCCRNIGACSRATGGPVPKPTKADAQNVVQIITSDKMKTQAYCDLTKLEGQVKAAAEKKDTKTLEGLSTQADALIDLSAVGKRCRPRAKMRRDGSRRTSPSCRSY